MISELKNNIYITGYKKENRGIIREMEKKGVFKE